MDGGCTPTHPGCNAMCLSCSPASLPLSYPFTLLVLKLYSTLLDTLLLFFSYPTLHRRCAASPSRYAAAVRALRGRRGVRTRLLTSCCVCHTGLEPRPGWQTQAGRSATYSHVWALSWAEDVGGGIAYPYAKGFGQLLNLNCAVMVLPVFRKVARRQYL